MSEALSQDELFFTLYSITVVVMFYGPILFLVYRRLTRKRRQLRTFANAVLAIMHSPADPEAVGTPAIRVEKFVKESRFKRRHESGIDLMERISYVIHTREGKRILKRWSEEDERLFETLLGEMRARHPFVAVSEEFGDLLQCLKSEMRGKATGSQMVDLLAGKIEFLEEKLRSKRWRDHTKTGISILGVAATLVSIFQGFSGS